MQLRVDIAVASRCEQLPAEALIERWIGAALAAGDPGRERAEVSVYLVDEEESRQLNHRYRGRDRPTNVLSFPAGLPEGLDLPLLGDLAVCAPVVRREAAEQGKQPEAHWAHMLVHGSLHLLGYDHQEEHDAQVMERMETDVLCRLNYPPPYDDIPAASPG